MQRQSSDHPRLPCIVALGGNLASPWGEPAQTLQRAARELQAAGVDILAMSRVHVTQPLGPAPQPVYANAVAVTETDLEPLQLLALAKQLEVAAGRRPGPRWGPRTLDIDIIDAAGRIEGWDRPHDSQHPAVLVLPHPEMHKRAFVLEPLCEVMPSWRHPVLGRTAAELLADL